MSSQSYRYEVWTSAGVMHTDVFPAAAGSLEYDGSRDVSKTLGSLVFLPNEWRKLNPVADEIRIYMILDDVEYPLGFFTATQAPEQRAVLLDPDTNEVSNLYTVAFADRMAKLIRSDGTSQAIQSGFDPSQEAVDLLGFVGVPFSWQNSVSVGGDTIVWDGGVTLLDKVVQLSALAGHRNPWMSNEGVVTSVVAQTPVYYAPENVALSSLNVEANSTVVTPLYLTAPNVVVVTGNSGNLNAPVTGRWDAPSAAPHSYANKGFFYTQLVSLQGLRDNDHAKRVARAVGEKNSARVLNFRCQPTPLIDGPTVLQYDDTLWVVQSYSIDLGSGGLMDVKAEELTDNPAETPGLDF